MASRVVNSDPPLPLLYPHRWLAVFLTMRTIFGIDFLWCFIDYVSFNRYLFRSCFSLLTRILLEKVHENVRKTKVENVCEY